MSTADKLYEVTLNHTLMLMFLCEKELYEEYMNWWQQKLKDVDKFSNQVEMIKNNLVDDLN